MQLHYSDIDHQIRSMWVQVIQEKTRSDLTLLQPLGGEQNTSDVCQANFDLNEKSS